MKTCNLLPSFIKRKFIILKTYDEKAKNEPQTQETINNFEAQNEEFQTLVDGEK